MTEHVPHLHPRDRAALKTATRLLVQSVGGPEAASAALGGYSVGRLSEAYAPQAADRWLRVDHVAELEAVAGWPHLTGCLARLAGHALLPIPAARGEAAVAVAEVLGGAGELGREFALAMRDGALSEAERSALVERLGRLAAVASHAQAVLAGPASPRLTRVA